MNCDCIERVNAKLKEAGHNYQLAPSIVFDENMQAETLLVVETKWIEQPKRSRKKPPSMICTYCPFCGKETRGNKQ